MLRASWVMASYVKLRHNEIENWYKIPFSNQQLQLILKIMSQVGVHYILKLNGGTDCYMEILQIFI